MCVCVLGCVCFFKSRSVGCCYSDFEKRRLPNFLGRRQHYRRKLAFSRNKMIFKKQNLHGDHDPPPKQKTPTQDRTTYCFNDESHNQCENNKIIEFFNVNRTEYTQSLFFTDYRRKRADLTTDGKKRADFWRPATKQESRKRKGSVSFILSSSASRARHARV